MTNTSLVIVVGPYSSHDPFISNSSLFISFPLLLLPLTKSLKFIPIMYIWSLVFFDQLPQGEEKALLEITEPSNL